MREDLYQMRGMEEFHTKHTKRRGVPLLSKRGLSGRTNRVSLWVQIALQDRSTGRSAGRSAFAVRGG